VHRGAAFEFVVAGVRVKWRINMERLHGKMTEKDDRGGIEKKLKKRKKLETRKKLEKLWKLGKLGKRENLEKYEFF
jgi:hypothetical protein